MSDVGPIGRLGRFAATNRAWVFGAWAVLALGLGVLAPRVEHALSGAGWQANGSESVRARDAIDRSLGGNGGYAIQVAVHSEELRVSDPAFARAIREARATLASDEAVSAVSVPRAAAGSISADGHTALIQAGAAKDPNAMVEAAADLKTELATAAPADVEVDLTGAPGMWSDFNKANKEAMLKSELISWPVTLAILVLAFGSLVAAGLPLMLTILGLVSSAGVLYLGTELAPISIWALNFALMFALALGIDYALFVVMRFRGGALRPGSPSRGGGRPDDGHGRQDGSVLGPHRAHLALRRDAGSEPRLPLGVPGDHGLGDLRAGGDADAAAGRARQARPAR